MPNTIDKAFMHRPRPYTSQRGDIRRFGKEAHITAPCGTLVSVLRVDGGKYASIVVREGPLHLGAALTPEQARELAAALIDAAHDIESHPATPAAEGGAA